MRGREQYRRGDFLDPNGRERGGEVVGSYKRDTEYSHSNVIHPIALVGGHNSGAFSQSALQGYLSGSNA